MYSDSQKYKLKLILKFDLVNDSNQVISQLRVSLSLSLVQGDVVVDNSFKMTKDDLPEIVRMGMNMRNATRIRPDSHILAVAAGKLLGPQNRRFCGTCITEK